MLTNKHITLVAISALLYTGFEKSRYKSWKAGHSVPSFVNISVMASYVALNMGFSDIYYMELNTLSLKIWGWMMRIDFI